MLPHIVSEEHARLCIKGVSWLGVAVRPRWPALSTLTITQPDPKTRAPAALKRSFSLSTPPKSLVDGGLEIAFGLSAIFCHNLPKHRMVGVAAGIVANSGSDSVWDLIELCQDLF